MKKYTLKQEYGIEDENGQDNKKFDCTVTVKEQGICKENILNMFNTIACGVARLLGEESGAYDNTGYWPDFDELEIEIDKNLKFDDGTPVFDSLE